MQRAMGLAKPRGHGNRPQRGKAGTRGHQDQPAIAPTQEGMALGPAQCDLPARPNALAECAGDGAIAVAAHMEDQLIEFPQSIQ